MAVPVGSAAVALVLLEAEKLIAAAKGRTAPPSV
jgi:hypothetical protein